MRRTPLFTLISLVPLLFLLPSSAPFQESVDATEIVRRADEKYRGESSRGEVKMTIVRPTWEREMQLRTWSRGTEYSLILVTAPARDKGVAFLKREKEIWNWQPSIDRVIKLPPSMMMQSWMGSDFKNDDLVKESSIIEDYSHELNGEEMIDGRLCYRIDLQPKPGAPVVWGRIRAWIDKADYLQLKTEFYDEDDYLVNTMYGKNVRTLGGKLLPATLEVIPADEEGHATILEYLELEFDMEFQDGFFSVQNMKRLRI